MSAYKNIRELDAESLENLQEGNGPVDECICSLLSPPDRTRFAVVGASIKRALTTFAGGSINRQEPQKTLVAPVKLTKGGKAYNKIKKLDDESLEKLQEGTGPADECICSILSPPEEDRSRFGAVGASIKKVFASLGGVKKRQQPQKSVDVPLTFTKGGKGIFTTKEILKTKGSCGKCGCDKDDVVLKHSYANIRIVTPDISNICPCPSDCLPEQSKLNNVQVTVEQMKQERLKIDPDNVDSEFSLHSPKSTKHLSEPAMEKRSVSRLINQQYEEDNYSDWSFEYEDDEE